MTRSGHFFSRILCSTRKASLALAISLSSMTFADPTIASNLITNPDFSAGNSGFSSNYTYNASSLYNANTYGVTTPTDPAPTDYNLFWTNPTPLVPAGSPSGTQMMMVNGGQSGTNTVWAESGIGVGKNTNYNFSVWVDDLYTSSPATLQFNIDGTSLGSVITVSNVGTWKQYYSTWYSGSNTQANLGLIDTNTAYFGNDFAMTEFCLSSTACNSGTSVGGTTGVGTVPLPPSLALLATSLVVVGLMKRLNQRKGQAA